MLCQLQSNGVITTTVNVLRHMVAAYLREHADTYRPFVVSSVVAPDSPYYQDPDAIDATISLIPDSY